MVLHGEFGPLAQVVVPLAALIDWLKWALQVRALDITLFSLEGDSMSKNVVEKRVYAGRFHVPKVSHEQKLFFDFAQVGNVVRCVAEYVASYGVYPCTVGSISLHC